MQAKTAIFRPSSVTTRLGQLGLVESALREAIFQAHLHRVRLTANHPRIFHGLAMWGWAVASLREQLRSLDWIRVDVGNFPLTVNVERSLAIAIASGDEGTGKPNEPASNRSRKGRNTVAAVESNQQQSDMFQELLPQTKEEADGNDTWVLLHHTDLVRKEIRLELSRPAVIGSDGKISAWSERIMLASIPFDDNPVDIVGPSVPDIDIPIRRKA